MTYNFGKAVGFPEANSDTKPVDTGRLAGVFCQLSRRAFTGLVHVETDTEYCVFSLREGTIVFAEESTPFASIADHMLGTGLVTREQYADVVSRMTDSLVDNEDLVFCEQAVALRYVSRQAVTEVMSQRIRAKVIQALGFTDCRVELDESLDAMVLAAEYPQDTGALVYMGVCTFYGEEYLAQLVPKPATHFMRLLQPLPAIVRYFGCDASEEKFLRSIDTETKLSKLMRASSLERTHALQILALLRIAGMAEFASTPYQSTPEPSGVRSTRLVDTRRSASAPIREQPTPPGAAAQPRRAEPTAPSVARRPVPPARDLGPTTLTTLTNAGRPAPAARAYASSGAHGPAAERGTVRPAQAPIAPASISGDDTTAQALAEAKARAAKRAATGHHGAAQRLGQQLSKLRGPASVAVPLPATIAKSTPADNPEYAKAHLKEILARRRQISQAGPVSQAIVAKRDPAAELKQAQDLLRDQQFGRAEELLRGLAEAEPKNEPVRAYHIWAKLRCAPDPDRKDSEAMRDLARKLVQDEEHAAFACYVIGHLAFVDKKDDVAEKFFRKAFARDRTNKDAERHLLILERRKQILAQEEAQGTTKIFGITIGSKKD